MVNTLTVLAAIVVIAAIVVVHRQSQMLAAASQPATPGFSVVRSSVALERIEKHSSTNRSTQLMPLAKSDGAAISILQTNTQDVSQQSLTNSGNDGQDTAEAREALALVGVDPDAETYWTEVINDPNVPASERRVLIQGLGQSGLSNPRNPSPDDMAIIANRIALIEEMAPNAIDQANADAFTEVYNNLVNLYNAQVPQTDPQQ